MARDKAAIRETLRSVVDFSADFHALNSAAVDALVQAAKAAGYRKPKNANGSTARYFFAYLNRRG